MSEITRKVTAVVLTLALALSVVPAIAQGQTIEDLQAQILELQALIAQLQGQTTTPAVGAPAACAGISFNRNLSLGSTGTDVRCLQALLNANAATRVAAAGVGSAGQETQYFGNLTRTAVVNFQNLYASEVLTPVGLTAGTGFVGAQTRAKLNAMLAGAPAAPAVPADPAAPVVPADPSVPATEGDLSTRLLPVPSNVEVDWSASNVSVMAVELEAKDSAINVQRIDLNFNTDRPWRYITHVALYDGANPIQGIAVNSANVTELTSSTSRVRFSGMNINVPKDSKKDITIRVSTGPNPIEAGKTLELTIDKDGIRGVDGLGINQVAPSTPHVRDFSIRGTAQGARIEVKLNANSPVEGIAITDEVDSTEHEVLRVDLVNTRDNVEVRELIFDVTTNTVTSGNFGAFRLYDGTTPLGVEAFSTTTVKFSNLSININAGSTKTLTLKTEVKKDATGTAQMALAATSTKINARSANDADVTFTGAANGEKIFFFVTAPVISNVSSQILETKHSTTGVTMFADARITFTLTAQGGNVVIEANGITPVAATSSAGVATTSAVSVTVGGEAASSARTILNGQSKVVVIDARISATSGTSVRSWLEVIKIDWDGGEITSAELLKLLKTNSVILN